MFRSVRVHQTHLCWLSVFLTNSLIACELFLLVKNTNREREQAQVILVMVEYDSRWNETPPLHFILALGSYFESKMGSELRFCGHKKTAVYEGSGFQGIYSEANL
jgi:hypothetical protein